MKPLDATSRVGSAVAMLGLSGLLSGCYYVPYGYYPGYGYYPVYSGAPTAATEQGIPVAPGDASQPTVQEPFTMPDVTSTDAPPAYTLAPAPAYGAPAYYPVAYPYGWPYPYPYYGYGYGWPGWWWPSASFSFAFWGGCCVNHYGHYHYGYWGHPGYWGGHGHPGYAGAGHGYSGYAGSSHAYGAGTPAGWGSGGGSHYWATGGGHGRSR
ncbi:hypothetical protein PQR02_20430 [Paraburkholderia sediminicola]|uniref:Uncharacterized protein n=1 Tax=Paraburkholderia rhynchosiae TaxID=487049 RepID=A0ACC7NPS5_9BURK